MKNLLDNWQTLNARLRQRDLDEGQLTRLINLETKGKNRLMILSRLRARKRMVSRDKEIG